MRVARLNMPYYVQAEDSARLILQPHALVPGATYRFELRATYEGATGVSAVDVTVNQPPWGGELTLFIDRYCTYTVAHR